MKKLNLYISEALVTSKPIGEFKKPKYQPTTKGELSQNIIKELSLGNENLNCIDTSAITDMSALFDTNWSDISKHIDINKYKNVDISEWDVSNVKDMMRMFTGYKTFNCDLSQWDVSNVKNTFSMFYKCENFNSDLSNWDVHNVKDMNYMFQLCKNFNCELSDLSNWDVSKIDNNHATLMFDHTPLANIYGSSPTIKEGKFIKN